MICFFFYFSITCMSMVLITGNNIYFMVINRMSLKIYYLLIRAREIDKCQSVRQFKKMTGYFR